MYNDQIKNDRFDAFFDCTMVAGSGDIFLQGFFKHKMPWCMYLATSAQCRYVNITLMYIWPSLEDFTDILKDNYRMTSHEQ